MDNEKNIQRWRLILGNDSQERLTRLNGGASILSSDMDLLDQARAAIYIRADNGGFGRSAGAGREPSNPQISRWLGDVRSLFDKELVTIIQNDAINRCGLKQLLFEPEL